jgi:hypothetical protein
MDCYRTYAVGALRLRLLLCGFSARSAEKPHKPIGACPAAAAKTRRYDVGDRYNDQACGGNTQIAEIANQGLVRKHLPCDARCAMRDAGLDASAHLQSAICNLKSVAAG